MLASTREVPKTLEDINGQSQAYTLGLDAEWAEWVDVLKDLTRDSPIDSYLDELEEATQADVRAAIRMALKESDADHKSSNQ